MGRLAAVGRDLRYFPLPGLDCPYAANFFPLARASLPFIRVPAHSGNRGTLLVQDNTLSLVQFDACFGGKTAGLLLTLPKTMARAQNPAGEAPALLAQNLVQTLARERIVPRFVDS